MRTELGQELRQARTARGLSLEAAGRAAKISQGYLHKLEGGKVENPSPRVLQRLGEVLGVPYGQLMRLADYLLPGDTGSDAPAGRPSEEVDVTTRQGTDAAPTNRELARLIEAVLRELAELRRGQEELARALERSGPQR